MWELSNQMTSNVISYLPPITLNSILCLILLLACIHLLLQKILINYFQITTMKPKYHINSLEYSYLYHLSIIILVLSQVSWNMFDLAIWVGSYVGVGFIRKTIHIIRIEREIMFNDYTFNHKIIAVLSASKIFGGILFIGSIIYFCIVQVFFEDSSPKLRSLLIFPTLMLAVDSFFLFFTSIVSKTQLLSYFNQNINQIPPTYKLDIIQNIIGNSIRVWHYYNLIRLFFKAFLTKIGFIDSLWSLSLFSAFFNSFASLLSSFKKYRNYSKLISNFNRIFRTTRTSLDQTCVICMSQLLNCRRLSSCGHLFHYKCLFQWIQTKNDCPICRTPINLVQE